MFDWISALVDKVGAVGVALLMFLENVFPPIPSELVMPLAGFVAARDQSSLTLMIVAGAIGSLAGATFWYYIGAWIGLERLKNFARKHGRWLTLTPKEIDKADAWFDAHGKWAVLVGRLIPTIRTLISVPAGMSGMRLVPFLLYSGLGTIAWTALLAFAGYYLEDQYDKVSSYLNPVSNVIIAGIVLFYLFRVATFRKRAPKQGAEDE